MNELVEIWLKHCKVAGHRPLTEGGTATYFWSPYTNRIWCQAKRCAWTITASSTAEKQAEKELRK